MSNYLHAFRKSVKNWYLPLIIGILLIVLGIYIFTVPQETYVALAIFFSLSFITSGLLDSIFALQNRDSLSGWGWYLISGLLSLVLGIYLTIYPTISMSVLPFVVGFTLLFRSFLLLGYSFELRDLKVVSWGDIALLSVIGIIFSVLLLSNPFFTGMSLVTLTALSLIFVGGSSIALSIRLKKVKNLPNRISAELKKKMEALHEEIEEQMAK